MRDVCGLAMGLVCFLLVGAVGHAATDPAARCKDTKARAAGKKAGDLMTAFGRNFKLPDPVRLAFSVSKAQSKLTKQFSKADARGGCQTVDDAAPIEAKVDALVIDVVAAFGGTTTTTTTSVSTTISTTTTSTTTTTTTFPPACDCCSVANLLSFTASQPTGNCGVLRNFRCSNNPNASCAADADCDEGPCGATVPGFCGDLNPLIECTSAADCLGTCGEVVAFALPFDLECGGLYSGWVGALPSRLSDTAALVADVTSCDGATGALGLGAATAAETGSERTCTSAGCSFGAPLPFELTSGGSTPSSALSICGFPSLAQDASGAATCNGVMQLDMVVDLDLYLGGDLLASTTPPDVPGVQPCPLCVRQCAGGTNDRFPCADDTDCTGGGVCEAATQCLGGANDTDLCTPGTGELGDGFPTSHDCLVHPSQFLRTLPLDLTLATMPVVVNAPDSAYPDAVRVFCGFCRDRAGAATLRFEGDPGGPPGGSADPVPCETNADCDDGDEFETCDQMGPGAFGLAAATHLALAGSAPNVCLADGVPRSATLASAFCFSPIPRSSGFVTIDGLYRLPGPGALTIQGDLSLLP